MNRIEGRWAEIVFWDADDVRALHKLEEARDKKNDGLIKDHKSPIEVWDLAFIEQMRVRHGLMPYWDKMIPESSRKDRMDQFCRAIYTYWRKLWTDDEDPDITQLHKADKLIFQSGIKPNRGNVLEKASKSNREGRGE